MSVLVQGLLRYTSPDTLERLARVRMLIIGAGGLGSNVAFMLARSGIRRFILVDRDRVEASNLNRQAYFPADLGRPKVEALAEPAAKVELARMAASSCITALRLRSRTASSRTKTA